MVKAEKNKESIVARIKKNMEAAKNSGGAKFEDIPRIKDGDKKRFRFLTDMEAHDNYRGPAEILMHSKWGEDDGLWPTPCESHEGKDDCQYCKAAKSDSKIRSIPWYAFTVRDLDEKKNYIFAHNCGQGSPVPTMMDMWDKFGTICDRAYEVKMTMVGGKRHWTLIPETPPRDGWKYDVGEKGFEPFKRSVVYDRLKKAGGWKNPGNHNGGRKKGGEDDDE